MHFMLQQNHVMPFDQINCRYHGSPGPGSVMRAPGTAIVKTFRI